MEYVESNGLALVVGNETNDSYRINNDSLEGLANASQ